MLNKLRSLNQTHGATAAPTLNISFKHLPKRILQDQKEVWTFPKELASRKHSAPTIGVIGLTTGLVMADPHIMSYFHRMRLFKRFDGVLSGGSTGMIVAAVPSALYLAGHFGKHSYAKQTALLAGEAYIASAIPHAAVKMVSRRLPPSAVARCKGFGGTFFHGHLSPFSRHTSFPSGHSAAAFSVATVISQRYRRYPWLPWIAYGLAGTIGFSRMANIAHFPSDIFLGASLGYTIARFDVLAH